MSTPFGAQSAWRQLVDLIGRRRVPPGISAIAKLKAIRAHVPAPIRAASARGVAFADPPAALVLLFAEDELAIAAPVLRTARLRADEWIEMLPGMSPAARSILRHRRDLPPTVDRALESFGSTDFVLPDAAPTPVSVATPVEVEEPLPVDQAAEAVEAEAEVEPVEAEAAPADVAGMVVEETSLDVDAVAEAPSIDWTEVLGPLPANEPEPPVAIEIAAPEPMVAEPQALAEPVAEPEIAEPEIVVPPESTFVSFASVALGLPVVAEAFRHSEAKQAPFPAANEVIREHGPARGG